MFIFWLISYFLIGCLCAAAYEVRSGSQSSAVKDLRIAWFLAWPFGLLFWGFWEVVDLCIKKYEDFLDWRRKVAAKAVKAYKHKSNC